MSDGKRMFRPNPATAAAPEPGKAPAPSVGDELRAKREEMGWKLPDVAAWLRIRLSYLEALEGDRPSEMPGSAYAVGFLRTYAKALGLNPEPLVERFKVESRGAFTRRAELSFPVPLPDRGLPTGVLLLCGIVVLVGAYVGCYRLTGSPGMDHDAPARLTLPGLSSATTASPQVASVLPPADEQPVPPPQPLPPQEREALTGAPAAPPPTPAPAPLSPPPLPPLEKMGEDHVPAAAPPEAAPTDSVTLTASATTWVQVRKPGGPVLYDHVLQPGETWQTPPGLAGLELTVGNAGGLTLSAAGVTTQPLGRNGEVRRNIALSPQAVADGSVLRAQAAPVTPPAPVTGNGNNPPSPLPSHVDPE
ncbi:helix-turn-helix domain-containing protein [Komagataeibacter sp. FNDCR2]|uniref:helix-turn-helix domain-containing protein n=1 Tax=Komagataeibacter sp. FNDCR2 TaxID=2878682 RepID=UPI001E43BF21|nr:helix-turn-helix domain-containing protein [Komagataeibacter sp. FNDCR2]MCE2574516.1 helix-turn-helix domain-containing protein [Komagataeibacter sp. FNDCR2]